jgi:hypothetical protein
MEGAVMADILTAEQVDRRLEAADQWPPMPQGHEIMELCASHEALRARCEQAERERDEWRQAADDFHVVNWIGTADTLTPKEAFAKAAEGALDQDRDELRERIVALEAHVRDWRDRCYGSFCVDNPECGHLACAYLRKSLALVPDKTGAK